MVQRGQIRNPALALVERDFSGLRWGAVRHWHLRPDDWHLIWPELIGADGAPDVPAAERVA